MKSHKLFTHLVIILLTAQLLASCQATTPTPQSLSNMTPHPNLPLNIAHRGARSLAPENTLLAAQLGLQAGADLWELDVAMTSDGELVVIHDDTLERTSDAAQVFPTRSPWLVNTFTLSELQSLDFGSWYIQSDPFGQIKAGTVYSQQIESYRRAPIPTLRQALDFTRQNDWRVNVEIKDASGTPADAQIVTAVVNLIEELGMQGKVIISSFKHDYLRQVRQLDSNLPTAALVDRPHPDPIRLLQELEAQAYNPGLKYLDYNQIAPLRAAGYGVNVWTVNRPEDMQRLIDAGVTGIFTDFPQVLKQELEQYR